MVEQQVKVYTTPSCPYCVTLKKFLENNEVDFEEVNVAEDQQALQEMKEKTGQMGVPVTEIGSKVIVGFNKKEIRELLDL